MHIFVEPQHGNETEKVNEVVDPEYESFEDDDFVIGNELTSSDDDAIYENNVDNVDSELDELDT
ncbi:hypothetical protein ACS0TY_022856 [Phlomoides rotata]